MRKRAKGFTYLEKLIVYLSTKPYFRNPNIYIKYKTGYNHTLYIFNKFIDMDTHKKNNLYIKYKYHRKEYDEYKPQWRRR